MNTSDNLVNAGEGVKLAIPANWRRNAVIAFSNGLEGEQGASVVVRRETLEPRITLQQYMDGLLVELARSVPEFAFIDRRSRTLAGHPAVEFLYTMSARGEAYEQRQVCALDIPGSVLSIVLTTRKSQATGFSEQWEKILASLVLGPPGEPRRP
ncbi:DcrB-related protein [Nannocystis punicea]|uniref:DcrB-related protein n=1 Tax=Nannocystis punicea TaxID=2995304 RepID=A0ABY7GXP4_9BACT|nr:DcrB-related protein [Nannocystis poenicansa]WAS91654.1 DcrB-related protein [Nannocystis poenicansa]